MKDVSVLTEKKKTKELNSEKTNYRTMENSASKTLHLKQQVFFANAILSITTVVGTIMFPINYYNWVPLWIFTSLVFLLFINIRWVKQIQSQLSQLEGYVSQIANQKKVTIRLSDNDYEEVASLKEELKNIASQMGVPTDIATKQLLPVDLEKNELESVIHCMSEGLIIYDMAMNVIFLNPALAQMLIPSNPAATGRLIQNPDDKLLFQRGVEPSKMKEIHNAMLEEPLLPRSDVIELKAPKQFLKRYSSPLYNSFNQQIGHVIIYHDITKEVETERMRSEFITNASHELRTPVTSLKVLLETLLSGAKDDPAIRDEFLNNLMREVDRMHILVNDLLDLSRLKSNQEKMIMSDVDVNKVISDAVRTVRPLAERKGVMIKENIQHEVKHVFGNQLRLGQVFVNLVNNAVKFTPNGGEVRVIARKHTNGFEFKVQDTGIGIPIDDLPYVFDRFYRVESNRKRGHNSGGSGLGLTIVKEVIEAHNGKIAVESDGHGTTFTFTIPELN